MRSTPLPYDPGRLCAAQTALARLLGSVAGISDVWLVQREEDDAVVLLVETESLGAAARALIPSEFHGLPVRLRPAGGPIARRGETFLATSHAVDRWLPRLLRHAPALAALRPESSMFR